MKPWVLVGLVLAAGLLWQAHRYGVLARVPPPPAREGLMPPGWHALARARPARVITLFGASNYNRSPMVQPLAEALSQCAGTEVVVRVVAKAGANSDWGMAHLDEALSGTDVLVIGFAGNDASLWRGMPLARSIANYRAMVEAAQARGVFVVLPNGGGSNIHGLNRLVRPGLPVYGARTGGDLARALGTALLPSDEARDRLTPAERRALMPDGLHATPEAVLRYNLPRYIEALRPLACP